MTKNIQSLKLSVMAGLASLAFTACVPGQYAYETTDAGANAGYYGGQYDGQYGYQSGEYAQYGTQVSNTRYGVAAHSSGLRPGCDMQAAPCGFMRVVPVYPITRTRL